MKYRKKPVVIEAEKLTRKTARKVAEWSGASLVFEQNGRTPAFLVIHTLEGDHRADLGDFVIRGVKGEFYPCKPDIFAATYEAVDD